MISNNWRLKIKLLENKFELLNDGMKVTLEYVDGKIINIKLPKTVK